MTRHSLSRPDEMRAAEERVIAAGRPGYDLMERAASALVEAAAGMAGPGAGILVLAGPGNNGGDGLLAGTLLRERGFAVTVAALVPPERLAGDAARAAAAWGGPVSSAADVSPSALASAGLVIDALFGIGLARDLDGEAAALAGRVNQAARPVLAVDIPSGVDGATGLVRGAAIRADRTLTFASRKPGHLLYPGRGLSGAVDVADIGIDLGEGTGLSENGPDLWLGSVPQLSPESHKYDRGHALVLSGPPAHTGAARMAARAALRAGAGLVSVVTSARALQVNAAQLTAIMLRVCDEPDELSDLLTDDRFNALLLGPALGVGEETRRWVEAALEADRATLLDADALTSFAGQVDALRALTGAGRVNPVVLTPHEGEFRRLFSGKGEPSAGATEIAAERSKLDRASRAAAFTSAVMILKGADTVIAAPDGRAAINTNGSPHLGTAGSGDVLGGFVCGLLARGMPGFEAACAAVWLHAEAGRRFGPGLIAEDLPELLPAVLRDLGL